MVAAGRGWGWEWLCSVVVTSSVYPHINITYLLLLAVFRGCDLFRVSPYKYYLSFTFILYFLYFLEFVRHLCGRDELYKSTSRKKQGKKEKR